MKKGFVHLFAFIILAAIAVAGIVVYRNHIKPETKGVSVSKKVVGYLVYWDKARGIQSIQNNADVFTEISPWAYTMNTAGDIILDPNGGASIVDDATVTLIKGKGMRISPTIHNLVGGSWNSQIVHDIITNPITKQKHITNIVNLAVSKGYDAIDIDYENLFAADRNAYSSFMSDLSTALHAQSKQVYVNVYGKTSEPGSWSGQQAQDYAALGRVVDQFRIFLYDYNPGVIGPVAPYSWVSNTLAFAITQMPAEKVMHGLPTYGYDWNNTNPSDKTGPMYLEAMATATKNNATVNWDATNFAPWYTYSNRTVWFENARSTGYKLDLTNKYNVGGVYLWRLGGEDPLTYSVIKDKFAVAPPPPPPPPPPVTYKSTVLTDSPLAYWRLGEASGTTATDEKATYNGTYLNGPTLGQPGAIQNDTNTSIGLNGINSSVSIPYKAEFNSKPFSVEAWAYPTGGTGYRVVAASRDYPNGWLLNARDLASGNNWSFWISNGGTAMLELNGSPVVLNKWAHLVGTYDGTSAKLYVNGVLAATGTTSTFIGNAKMPFIIGNAETGQNYPFVGRVDDVSYYKTALTSAQVYTHYSLGSGAPVVSPPPPPPANQPPTVSITKPANGATLSWWTLIQADAKDDKGVAKVEFYLDGRLIKTEMWLPYSFLFGFKKVASGTHTITATAYDTEGLKASSSITVRK